MLQYFFKHVKVILKKLEHRNNKILIKRYFFNSFSKQIIHILINIVNFLIQNRKVDEITFLKDIFLTSPV